MFIYKLILDTVHHPSFPYRTVLLHLVTDQTPIPFKRGSSPLTQFWTSHWPSTDTISHTTSTGTYRGPVSHVSDSVLAYVPVSCVSISCTTFVFCFDYEVGNKIYHCRGRGFSWFYYMMEFFSPSDGSICPEGVLPP